MSSERVFAQDFNATRIKALSYLFAEIWPKIKICSLTRLFPLKGRAWEGVFFTHKILKFQHEGPIGSQKKAYTSMKCATKWGIIYITGTDSLLIVARRRIYVKKHDFHHWKEHKKVIEGAINSNNSDSAFIQDLSRNIFCNSIFLTDKVPHFVFKKKSKRNSKNFYSVMHAHPPSRWLKRSTVLRELLFSSTCFSCLLPCFTVKLQGEICFRVCKLIVTLCTHLCL